MALLAIMHVGLLVGAVAWTSACSKGVYPRLERSECAVLAQPLDCRRSTAVRPSLERGQQLLRARFRIEATLRLGEELKPAPINLRELTLPDQAQEGRHQEVAVPPGRFVGGQFPSSTRRLTVETPTPRARATSAVLTHRGFRMRAARGFIMDDSDVPCVVYRSSMVGSTASLRNPQNA
jgi:hypothetical protein